MKNSPDIYVVTKSFVVTKVVYSYSRVTWVNHPWPNIRLYTTLDLFTRGFLYLKQMNDNSEKGEDTIVGVSMPLSIEY